MPRIKRTFALVLVAALLLCPLTVGADTLGSDTPPMGRVFSLRQIPEQQVLLNGDLSEWSPETKLGSISRESLLAGEGFIWRDADAEPQELTADIYLMCDDVALYVGVVATYAKHSNAQRDVAEMWREDCLIMQISAHRDKGRNEWGFMLSTWGSKTPIPYAWDTPETHRDEHSGDVKTVWEMPHFKNRTTGMYVTRDDATQKTTYEIRVPIAGITPDKETFKVGDSLYMAFALHTEGGWYEWGDGVLGTAEEKDITLARKFTVREETTVCPPPPSRKTGDVNGNNKIDSTDARMILQHEVGLLTLSAFSNQWKAADVNGDEVVDSSDARSVLQFEVRLIITFPRSEFVTQ